VLLSSSASPISSDSVRRSLREAIRIADPPARIGRFAQKPGTMVGRTDIAVNFAKFIV
jgi:hypothetical protein